MTGTVKVKDTVKFTKAIENIAGVKFQLMKMKDTVKFTCENIEQFLQVFDAYGECD